MTTIATDGQTMAGDGLCTGGGLRHGFNVRKVFKLKDGRVVGVAGSSYAAGHIIDWLEDPTIELSLPDDVETLVLTPDGRCLSYNEKGRSIVQETPAVAGSGGALALGAMLAGKSPKEAVAIAAQRDIYTGGAITEESL